MGSAKKRKARTAGVADQPIQNARSQQVTPGTDKTNYFFAFLLILATALLYSHSLWNPLVFDDLPFFIDANLARLGSSFFQLDLRWFPYASLGWTYKLFGIDLFWYRLGNVALHALTSILLFVFFSRLLNLTQLQATVTRPNWSAFFAALIFALHPVAVYGVAYLVERSIIMATLFGIAGLLCYMEGLTRNKQKWFILSALFYFLAVFSKEHSIMIPGVAVALTLLLHKPSFSLVKKLWLPFALYMMIGVYIVLQSHGVLGTVYEPHVAFIFAQMSDQQHEINIEHAFSLSIITQGYLFFKYLLLWLVPYPGWMSIDIRQPFALDFLSWPQLPGFILFLAYSVVAIKLLLKGGRQGLLGFGLLFPWILFLTELSTVRIQEPFVLYRSYLWMSGLPIVLCSFMDAAPRKLAYILLTACCLVLAGLAWNRLDTFSDNITTWSDAIGKYNSDNLHFTERAYNNRGIAYMESGDLQKAQEDFIKTITINPKYFEAYANIGVVNLRQENQQAALQSYNKAIELKPDYVLGLINRSTLFLQMGRYADALNDCKYALQLGTQNTDAYLNCSFAQYSMGKTREALPYVDDALRINPRLVVAYLNRSIIKSALGDNNAALDDLHQALRIDSTNAQLYYHRGIVHSAMRRFQDALDDYSKAIELDAKQENAYINRGHIFASQSRYEDALINYDIALTLNSKNGQTLLNRGAVLLALNKREDALESYRKSCAMGDRQGCKMAATSHPPHIYPPRIKTKGN